MFKEIKQYVRKKTLKIEKKSETFLYRILLHAHREKYPTNS